ncbi:MAG: arginine--tRNA ligase [Planctomycetota bacterium]
MKTPPSTTSSNFDPVALLSERLRAAIVTALPEAGEQLPPDFDAQITPSRNPKFGDFQCNAAMGLGKRFKKNPRELAAAIVEHSDLGDLAESLTPDSIAGPGFINIRLQSQALAELVGALDQPELGLPAPAEPGTVVVDLCGVNLAKQMHVGHLRSTVIGDTIARVFERIGHKVVRQNHLGDWGLPIAMVTGRLMRAEATGELALEDVTLDQLNRLYRAAQAECQGEHRGLGFAKKWKMGPKIEAELEARNETADEALAQAKQTLIRLQSGDAEVVRVWKRIEEVTMAVCLNTCERLHTRIDGSHTAGESSYRDELAEVVSDLETRRVAELSDGALVVRVDGIKEPCLIRKSDGGFLYATTDIAAIRRRIQKLGGDRAVYCVDARQGLHFKQVFGASVKAGYATRDGHTARLEHAAFGTVLGPDNKPLKTRSGENVKLDDLLNEGVERAEKAVRENVEADRAKGWETIPEADIAGIASAVGIAAIKYADLSTERTKDYVFDFDRMVAFQGDTGPYLLYASARIGNIMRKATSEGVDVDAAIASASIQISEAAEKDLALALLPYPNVVRGVGESLEPHRLCGYLYDLSTAFSSFYDKCSVLKAPDEATRNSRLRLCHVTGRVLKDGLETLGLPTVERM